MSFSWKRAVGISGMKNRISRKIGIPLTKSGRERKVGRALGCCVPSAFILAGGTATIFGIAKGIAILCGKAGI